MKFKPLSNDDLSTLQQVGNIEQMGEVVDQLVAEYKRLREYAARLIPTVDTACDLQIKARVLQCMHEEGWDEKRAWLEVVTGYIPRGIHEGELTL